MAGGFLLAAAAVTVFSVTIRRAGPGPSWVVAAHAMGPGAVIGPADLTTEHIKLPGPTAALAYADGRVLIGRSLVVTVRPGQLIESTLVAPRGGGPVLRPVTVAVDPASLGGLGIGQRVDVLETDDNAGSSSSGSGPGPGSTGAAGSADASTPGAVSVVLRGASVMAIAKPGSGLESGPTTGEVTLGVPTLAEVEAAVAAAHAGTITLVAAEPSDGVGLGPPPSGRSPGGSGSVAGSGSAGGSGSGSGGRSGAAGSGPP